MSVCETIPTHKALFNFNRYLLLLCPCVCMYDVYVHMWVSMCHGVRVEVRGHLLRVGSLPLLWVLGLELRSLGLWGWGKYFYASHQHHNAFVTVMMTQITERLLDYDSVRRGSEYFMIKELLRQVFELNKLILLTKCYDFFLLKNCFYSKTYTLHLNKTKNKSKIRGI